MAGPAVIPIRLVRCRALATDGWCDRCLKPSVATVELLVHVGGGQPRHDRTMRYLHARRCVDCGDGGRVYRPDEAPEDRR